MIINEPINSPFKTVNDLHYSWLPQFQKEAQDNINALLESIKYEATEVDCNSVFLDESLLYDKFKNNIECDEHTANFILMKYLNYYLQIKMIKYVSTGEWLFTDNDVEMLDYFAHYSGDKCRPKFLRMTKKIKITILDNTFVDVTTNTTNVMYKYVIHYVSYINNTSHKTIHAITYTSLFVNWFGQLSAILTHLRTARDCTANLNVKTMFNNLQYSFAMYATAEQLTIFNDNLKIYTNIISESEYNRLLSTREYDTNYGYSEYTYGMQHNVLQNTTCTNSCSKFITKIIYKLINALVYLMK